jgi:hypothetical protein
LKSSMYSSTWIAIQSKHTNTSIASTPHRATLPALHMITVWMGLIGCSSGGVRDGPTWWPALALLDWTLSGVLQFKTTASECVHSHSLEVSSLPARKHECEPLSREHEQVSDLNGTSGIRRRQQQTHLSDTSCACMASERARETSVSLQVVPTNTPFF